MKQAFARHQRGVAGGILMVAIVLIVASILIARVLTRTDVAAQGDQLTRQNLARASEELVRFASVNLRLPCPALGTDDAGVAAPAGASATCTDATGVVPWQTLGLRREHSLDGWGRKLSYRVFSGTNGLTQTGGASATDCNTTLGSSLGPLDTGNKCRASHVNTFADFISGKGISVNDDGTMTSGVAFVLVSHGESGYGAYIAEGTGRMTLPTGGGREATNTGSAAPFQAGAKSASTVAATDSAHFDDVVAYRTINELISASALTARAYAGVTVESVGTVAAASFTLATVTALVGTSSHDTGQTSINFGTFTATAGLGRNISSIDPGSGEGIGSIIAGGAPGGALLNSAAGEFIMFTFNVAARSLGVTISDISRSSAINSERVRFTFYQDAVTVATITRSACTIGNVAADYSLDPGASFNRVDVTSINQNDGSSSFILVGSLRTCSADITPSLCKSPTSVPANDCP